jgi:hypothetical protein
MGKIIVFLLFIPNHKVTKFLPNGKIEFFCKKSAKNFCVLEKKCTFAASKKSGRSTVGSVPGLGPGGRTFESCHPDQKDSLNLFRESFFVFKIFPRTLWRAQKNPKTYVFGLFWSDPGGIQTRNPHIRSVVLYSVELRNQQSSL